MKESGNKRKEKNKLGRDKKFVEIREALNEEKKEEQTKGRKKERGLKVVKG